ncbi:hypothetical protein ASF89_00665 [Frigoribacterium sp. Leaf172]|nr:hypothetical protein ASF89_00665 [Frigoribacterium sp. Leaf172]
MYFPDNTVMINFAIIGEMGLLKRLLRGQGQWVGAVEAECEDSYRTGLYIGIDQAFEFMPDPILLEPFETREARLIRQSIADPLDKPTKSLGEAETIAVITNRRIHGATFITDDEGAKQYIVNEDLPIKVYTTTDLLALAVKVEYLTQELAEAHIDTLVAQRRKRISINRFHRVLRQGSQNRSPQKSGVS